ncbi:MAG: hypothetical protein R3F25_00825 [Gammaproteobacteria bacterium]|jgi:hypothetical protein|nr:hypothetical protein [Xanthomonadales bacterium]
MYKLIYFIGFTTLLLTSNSFSFELFKGVILDKESSQILIASPENGIKSIDASTGNVNWKSDSADIPIAVIDSKILTQKSSKNLKFLAISTLSMTGQTLQIKELQLPQDVSSQVQDTIHSKFNLTAYPTFDNISNTYSYDFQWSFFEQKIQGMMAEEITPPTQIFGSVVIDDINSLELASVKPMSSRMVKQNIHVESDNLIPAVVGRKFKSISGDYVLVSNQDSDNAKWDNYIWTIYSVSGQVLGSIMNHSSFRPFEVIGEQLVFVDLPSVRLINNQYETVPLSVKSYSLTNSSLNWTKEIRDFSYKGPYPH